MKNTSAIALSLATLAVGLGVGFGFGHWRQNSEIERVRAEASAAHADVWLQAVDQLESARDSLIGVAAAENPVSSIEREFEYYIETTQQLADGKRRW